MFMMNIKHLEKIQANQEDQIESWKLKMKVQLVINELHEFQVQHVD